MMKGEQQKIFHKGLDEKINPFITLLYPSNKIKFKISKSRTSTDFIDHLRNIGSYIKKSKIKRFILVTDNASFHVSRQTKQFIDNQPSTVTELPWSNNLSTFDTGNTQHHNIVISSTQTFTNSKNLDVNHAFVSNKVVGPDRFRFITSYWTTSQTNRGVDVGTSANDTFVSANSLPPNQKIEVYPNEGSQTLAVVLQYEGVVDLAGVTGALKLPAGFKVTLPLTSDKKIRHFIV